MAARNSWVPTGDLALLQLRLQAMPEDPPELGVYSRLGWSHPGPAFWWVMWAGFTAFGGTSGALLVTIAVTHAALLILAWWLVRRSSPGAAVWVLAAGVVVLWARGSDFVLSPWNPYIGVVGVLALIGAAVGLANRDAWGAVFLLPVGSLLVQSHVGYAPLTVVLSLVALLLGLVRGASLRSFPWFATAFGALMAAVMWFPPLIEQFTNEPGNLQAITSSVTGAPTLTLSEASKVVLATFTVPPAWAPSAFGLLPEASETPWLVLIPVIALGVAAIRRDDLGLRVLGVAWAGPVAALISAANLQPPAYEYLLPWVATAAATLVALSCWVILGSSRQKRAVAVVLGFATVALAAMLGYTWAQAPPVLDARGQAAATLAEAVLTDASGRPVAIVADPDAADQADRDNAAGVATGMVVVAQGTGADVALDAQNSGFIDGVIPAAGPQYATYYVRVVRAGDRRFDSETVAVFDPFTEAQWAQLAELDLQLQREDIDALTRFTLAQQRNEVSRGQVAYEVRRGPDITG